MRLIIGNTQFSKSLFATCQITPSIRAAATYPPPPPQRCHEMPRLIKLHIPLVLTSASQFRSTSYRRLINRFKNYITRLLSPLFILRCTLPWQSTSVVRIVPSIVFQPYRLCGNIYGPCLNSPVRIEFKILHQTCTILHYPRNLFP